MKPMHRNHDLHDRRRSRNYGVLAILLAFVILSFLVTVVKMSAQAGL